MKIYNSTIVNPLGKENIQLISDGALVVSPAGIVEFIGDFALAKNIFQNSEILDFKRFVIMPGLIDLHSHIPQYNAIGMGEGELLDWLNNYIFPLEARFSNEEFACNCSRMFFEDALKFGTSCQVAYSSIHLKATALAFQVAKEIGIKAFIGKTMMDAPSEFGLSETVDNNIKHSEYLAKQWHKYDDGRLQYILTPRFAGSCSFELLRKCAELAHSEDLYIQTHLSENLNEIQHIRKMFPEFANYTEIYKASGILNSKVLLAHCIYLSKQELESISNSNAKIVHCPSSNRFLQSGIFSIFEAMGRGIQVGLGTDIAGGYSQSMFNEAVEAIETSKTNKIIGSGNAKIIDPETALYLCTLGAAEILGIENKAGNFVKGKDADFIIIENFNNEFSNLSAFLGSIIYRQLNKPVQATYIRGKCVYENKY